jgi:hypothetical protein
MIIDDEHQPISLRPGTVAWRAVDDGIVALDLATEEYLTLNASGAALWPGLVAGTTVAQMADDVVRTFDVARPQAAADVQRFLHALHDRGLLQVGPP